MKLNTIKNKDCLEYLRTLPSDSIDLVVTDQPYNVSQKNNISTGRLNVIKKFCSWDFDFEPIPVLKELTQVLKPTGQMISFVQHIKFQSK
jgi:DNA modification methylase